MILINNKEKYIENIYKLEADFERDVFENSSLFFGEHSILIDSKKKIESNNLGNSIPDGFLLDFKDPQNPEFYLIEVELVSHDFYRHIFPQITKFFAFLKNPKNQGQLIEKIYNIIEIDTELKEKVKKYAKNQEIYKLLKDVIENNSSILLIIDGDKPELPEIIDTYTDTWGEYVKVQKIQKFISYENKLSIFTIDPEFEFIDFSIQPEPSGEIDSDTVSSYTEAFHLEKSEPHIQSIYLELKELLQNQNPNYFFNPQKYYIGIKLNKNKGFIIFNKKKIRVIILKQFNEVREIIKDYKVIELSEGVQKFWNGPSCAVIVDSNREIQKIANLILSIE
ncbi:hypothetical protein [Leptospira sp. 'Mane']|uniref:hypothetical protein n=1 Tax=Leptospira sp. 'Mane' TaxID=3387407 RepID=UPI00398A97AB